MDIETLKNRLAMLEQENARLKAMEVSTKTGIDMWGRPRAMLTEDEKASFRNSNIRFKDERATPADNAKLALAARVCNIMQANAEMRKKLSK